MPSLAKFALLALIPAAVVGTHHLASRRGCMLQRWLGHEARQESLLPGAVAGTYVEARSASVFGGPCHYNGEYTTQGREQIFAWSLSEGERDGISLAGARVVVATSGDDNLAEAAAEPRSVIYLDEAMGAPQRDAAVAWVRDALGARLGRVVATKSGAVRVDCDGDRYDVDALGLVRLDGRAMPDRSCCTMPQSVWYEPAQELTQRLVGCSASFELRDPDLGPALVRKDENNAFVGVLAAPQQCCVRSRCSGAPAPATAAP